MSGNVSLHLRLGKSFEDLFKTAKDLNLQFFQCFLLQDDGKYVDCNKKLQNSFKINRCEFKALYLHASYYINLAMPGGYRIAKRELHWAKKLGFTHFILHPGAQNCDSREESLAVIGKTLNELVVNENQITIMLENTAHGNKSIGGNIQELATIRSYLQTPEKLKFCIDTAHAHSFGYKISTASEQNLFLSEFDRYIGLDSVELIHLNDTSELLGSKIDKHCYIGEGILGLNSLKTFSCNPKIYNIPTILELPVVNRDQELAALTTVASWKPDK